ncbi:MAG: oligoendopeptidase F [Gammaproteobacteria bacterium]|nr:oligoendopeptidase F [Gammaproteobacteria bacterium]
MKWDLSFIFKSDEEFEKGLEVAAKDIELIKNYKGQLGNEEKFVEYYKLQRVFLKDHYKLYLYASSKMDQDRRENKYVAYTQKVMYLFSLMDQYSSFESSEILSLGKDYVFKVLDNHKELEPLRYGFTDLFRRASHTPTEDAQKVIANYSMLSEQGRSTYGSLSSADSKKRYAKYNGEKVEVTKENWTRLVAQGKTEKDRKNVFEAAFTSFEEYKNTYASIYNTVLQADIALARSKNFDTALEMHLFQNNIPVSLYHNLIKAAHKLAPLAKRYYKIRKEVLGLKRYHTYDRFLNLAGPSDKKYSYEEAKELFYDSIKRFDDEFQGFAHEVTKDGYVDVLPSQGKRGGAYSNSVPGVHPIILLNFGGTLNDVFTLAHESGHSTHTMFSQKYQPLETESYTIFVAEIASTFNEHNLLDYLLNKGELSKSEKVSLIQNAIDDIMSTFYRQTLFAEYEYIAHTKAENGEPITSDTLSQIMIDLYKRYYGLNLKNEKVKEYVWAYIPHFFNSPYYVYQYATSFSASLAIYEKVKNNEPNAFENYKEMLKSGGSDYPINIVKKAGVDFTKMDAINGVVTRYAELLDELEEALKA